MCVLPHLRHHPRTVIERPPKANALNNSKGTIFVRGNWLRHFFLPSIFLVSHFSGAGGSRWADEQDRNRDHKNSPPGEQVTDIGPHRETF